MYYESNLTNKAQIIKNLKKATKASLSNKINRQLSDISEEAKELSALKSQGDSSREPQGEIQDEYERQNRRKHNISNIKRHTSNHHLATHAICEPLSPFIQDQMHILAPRSL